MDIWDHTKVLDLISLELRARETCVVPNQLSPSTDGKNEVVMICSRVHPYMWQEPLGAHVGQTLSNMCFVKVSIGRINVGWLRILKLGKNLWEKERGVFCVWMLIMWVVIVQNRNLVFYCKEMHNSAICHNKKDKRGKTATIDSSTNYASNFSSALLLTTEILLENPKSTE